MGSDVEDVPLRGKNFVSFIGGKYRSADLLLQSPGNKLVVPHFSGAPIRNKFQEK